MNIYWAYCKFSDRSFENSGFGKFLTFTHVDKIYANIKLVESLHTFLNTFLDVPVSDLHKSESVEHIREKVSTITNTNKDDPSIPVVFVCRRGNDSQIAVNRLKEKLKDEAVTLMDISGGLTSWAKKIDPDFPTY